VENGLAYVAEFQSGLRVFNLNDPASPVEVGNEWALGSPDSIAKVGSYVYLGTGMLGVQIIDASDPSAPRWVDTLVTDDTVVDVSSGSGSVAVSLLSGKVEIYAVDEGGALRRTSSYQSTGWVDDTRLTGTALHVVYSSGLVDIVDLTEPARPRRAELTNEGTVSVTRRHGDDFTVTRSPLGGLEVFDLAPEEAE
jgi:hypothetical protein